MQNMVAVYPTREKAEQVRKVLIDSGVPASQIELSPERSTASGASEERPRGFWDFLFGPGGIFGSDMPEEHRSWYEQNLIQGRTALCVHLQQDELHDRVGEILHGHEPMEPPARQAAAGIGSSRPAPATGAGTATETEQKIPLVREELDVGKRQAETRYRVRVYTTERPVEETVTLRDEKVVVERRPVAGQPGAPAPDGAPREFDVVERHEEPVATKKARVDEEVVVHKEVRERQEVVRDKVKETKVDVDKGSGARR